MAGIIRPMQASAPSTRYARNGSIHLAYQVLGEGPPDLLVVNSGPASHVDHQWNEPHAARVLRRLASFSRLIVYDNRGVGMSDPDPDDPVATMDESRHSPRPGRSWCREPSATWSRAGRFRCRAAESTS